MRYKPREEIEAVQWTGTNIYEIARFVGENVTRFLYNKQALMIDAEIAPVQAGDYLWRDEKGKIHTCSKEIFELCYRKGEK